MDTTQWESEVTDAWSGFGSDQLSQADFLGRIEELAARAPAGSGAGPFEQACAYDSTGRCDLAVPLYEQALQRGLDGERRRRAVIQLASSLRNLGRAEDSVVLLTASSTPAMTSSTTPSGRSWRWRWSTWAASGRRSRSPSAPWRRTYRATSAR